MFSSKVSYLGCMLRMDVCRGLPEFALELCYSRLMAFIMEECLCKPIPERLVLTRRQLVYELSMLESVLRHSREKDGAVTRIRHQLLPATAFQQLAEKSFEVVDGKADALTDPLVQTNDVEFWKALMELMQASGDSPSAMGSYLVNRDDWLKQLRMGTPLQPDQKAEVMRAFSNWSGQRAARSLGVDRTQGRPLARKFVLK